MNKARRNKITKLKHKKRCKALGIKPFYCQSEIEGNDKCIIQCDHCKEYYNPLV